MTVIGLKLSRTANAGKSVAWLCFTTHVGRIFGRGVRKRIVRSAILPMESILSRG